MDSAGGVDFSLTVPRCPRPLVLSSPVSAGKDPARAQSEPAATQPSLQMKGLSSITAITGNWKKKKRKSSSLAAASARSDRIPFNINEAHEIHPGDEFDWDKAEDEADWAEVKRLRWVRDSMIKEKLKRGKTVQYRSGGSSLYPRVHSGDTCMFEPVTSPSDLELGHIVFCQVQPGGRYHANTILRIDGHTAESAQCGTKAAYTIGTQKGRGHGWYYREHIHGKLIEVSRQ